MAVKKRRLKPAYIITGIIAVLLILFANLADKSALGILQAPFDAVNNATGGVLYSKSSAAELKDLSVHFIDVGQGDSVFICCDGENMLIDGGPASAAGKTEKYLASYGISSLKYLIATHPHEDHIGGLINVLNNISAENIIMTDATTNTATYSKFISLIESGSANVIQAKPGASYTLGSSIFTILAPNGNYEDLNDTSVVVRLVYKNRSFLFTGDASEASEKDMLGIGYTLHSDVLKVGHHGSSTATSEAFLKAVSPQIAVISVGRENSYGLPDESVLDELTLSGVSILRTDQKGTIIISSDGDTLNYTTEK